VFLVAAVFISRRLGTLPLFHRLTLPPPPSGGAAHGGQIEGRAEPFAPPPVRVGEEGIAQSALRPGGKGRFGNRYVDVLTVGDFINRGRPIRVVRITGNQVVVEQIDAGE
jgi:membrane-bound serine protease (ClpP class)